MQTIQWYASRLRAMTPEEIAWRARTAVRNDIDRVVFAAARRRAVPPQAGADLFCDPPPFRVGSNCGVRPDVDLSELCRRADAGMAHRFKLPGIGECALGEWVDWNRDYEAQRTAPLYFAPTIDYRDYSSVGDAQLIWQLNRHQHLPILGFAYDATRDPAYAEAVARDLTSWLDQCPYPYGLNWRDSLEVAIRLINWVWAIDLVRDSGALSSSARALGKAIEQHVAVVSRSYARGSSANNHRIGEAAGVLVACSYFPLLTGAAARLMTARRILLAELDRQVHADGVNREQSFGYHEFASELFAVAETVARATDDEFPPAARARIGQMNEFDQVLRAGGLARPSFGDSDDGHVFDDILTVLQPSPEVRPLRSRAFADSGHYLLQSGAGDERVSVHFRCGPFGFGRLAAHAHADQLAFTLRIFGEDVLVDPGTYDYFREPAWRRYFRSTAAHNTITVDGVDQADNAGPFLWERHPEGYVRVWEPTRAGGTAIGFHSGYQRLPRPVLHKRGLTLDAASSRLSVIDELSGPGDHNVAFRLHFGECCEVERNPGEAATFTVRTPRLIMRVSLDPSLDIAIARGRVAPIAGWVSHRYHVKVPIDTVIAVASMTDHVTLRSTFEWEPLPRTARHS